MSHLRARHRRALPALLLAAVTLSARHAAAFPVTVWFSGAIDVVAQPGPLEGTGIGVGTPYQGWFTIDPVGATFVPSSPTLAIDHYRLASAMTLHVEIAGLVIDTDYDALIYHRFARATLIGPAGSFGLQPFRPDRSPPQAGFDVAFTLADAPPNESHPGLPLVTSLDGWDAAAFYLGAGNGPYPGDGEIDPQNPNFAYGAIQSLVPEPGAAVLFALALVSLAARKLA